MKTSDELENQKKSGRRDFLKIDGLPRAANLIYTALPVSVRAETTEQASTSAAHAIQEVMPTRNLGRTGFRVGIFGLGGQGALDNANNEAIALPVIEKSLELGVNGSHGSRADSLQLDAASGRRAEKNVGGDRRHRHHAGHANQTRNDVYTLSVPISTAIIGCDSVAQVEECVQLAREFTPLNDSQMAELTAKTEPIAKQALFFPCDETLKRVMRPRI